MKALRPLTKDDYKLLYIQLADRIVKYIKHNYLNPGDLLPSQNELLHYYGISGPFAKRCFVLPRRELLSVYEGF